MPYTDPDYHKKWSAENAEHLKEYKHNWYVNNKDKAIASRLRNAERITARRIERRDEINAKRRWRYHNIPGRKERDIMGTIARKWRILYEELDEFKAMYSQPCFYCGAEPGVRSAVDHLMPRSRGGADRLYNLVPCCISCNSQKRDKTPGEWYDATRLALRQPSSEG